MIRQLCLILVPVLLLVYACGPSNSENSTGTDDELKIFRYNQTGGLTSLDPAKAGLRSNIWATTQLYNGLFNFTKDLYVHPELAQEWDVSDDGKVYTFTIREGIRFHDNKCFEGGRGREVKASDFVYSFKRILNSGNGSWIFNDKVLLGPDGNPSDTCFATLDDYRFRIYLNRRFPAFLQILAMPYCFVVPKEALDTYGEDFDANPVGTGPFQFVNWVQNESLLLTRNEHYWKSDTLNQLLPYLDRVQVTFKQDRNQEFLTFYEGDLEWLPNLAQSSRDKILEKSGEIKESIRDKFSVQKMHYLNTEYVGFNVDAASDSPFKNTKLRQAMSYAVNRQSLVSFIRNGLGTPGDYGVVPIALPSFDSTRVKGYSYNQAKAQELLREAGFPEGNGLPSLKLNTYQSDKEIAEFLQNDWKAIGINVEIETNQFSTHKDLVDNGRVNLFRGSWLGDYPDAENYLAMFYSQNFAPDGPNKTHFTNDEFDRLFEEAHETDNLFTQYEDYYKMDQIVMDFAPVIVLYYDEVIQLTQPYVVGLEADPMNTLRLEKVDIKNSELAQE